MAFQFAVSVSHNDMEKELWANRMAESGIGAFEYSCGGFPEIRDLRNKIAFLTPYLQEGKFSFPVLFYLIVFAVVIGAGILLRFVGRRMTKSDSAAQVSEE